MGTRLRVAIAIALGSVAAGCTALPSPVGDASPSSIGEHVEVQAHLGRLRAEARIAADHVGFAVRRPGDLRWMQREIRHVRHAIDPSSEEDGPGLGYGVLPSADAALAALGSGPPTDGSQEGTNDESKPARSAIERAARAANDAMVLTESVLAEEQSTERAAQWVRAIERLVGRVRDDAGADMAPVAHAGIDERRARSTIGR